MNSQSKSKPDNNKRAN